MRGISQLRRGRGLIKRAKRLRVRRKQPRFANVRLKSDLRAAPRKPTPTQPYLGSDARVEDLL
jgi:hypothetical protein